MRDKQLCERVVRVRGSMFQHIAFSFLTTISVVGLLRATWDPIVACLGTNPYTYRVLLSFFLVTSLYFVVGSLFAVMDLTLSPKALRKYKTQVAEPTRKLSLIVAQMDLSTDSRTPF